MKALMRIPTVQYGYIEIGLEGTVEEIIKKHNEFIAEYKKSQPLTEENW